jgi:hypothetical protein
MSAALRSLVSAVFALLRRHARRLGFERPRPGAVAFLQGFSDALLLHPHIHLLVGEGMFHGERHDFAALPPPRRRRSGEAAPGFRSGGGNAARAAR